MEDLGLFCGHLISILVIWCIFPRDGKLYQEKSGNPAFDDVKSFQIGRLNTL
jgi:hypothetical protein